MKFCVIGLGRFGYQVAESLASHGMEVLAVDRSESNVASIRDKVTQAICNNIQNEESLRAIGADEMDTAIVSMGENFAQSILVTALLKKHMQVPFVIARAISTIHEDILKLVGADTTIIPERAVGIRLANNLSFPFIDVVNVSDDFSISQIRAPEQFIGKAIDRLHLLKLHNVSCIGVKKGSEIELVDRNYVVLENDLLVFAGKNDDLESLARL